MSDFALYWWTPRRDWVNLGDEISPIILSHVSGRNVVHASADDCDGIAIGSIFNPRKATFRKRSAPLLIWGSGTLRPQPCSYANLNVKIAALRGPHTAGQIENCPDVPFGDPGLFVREVWERQGGTSDLVGIIPHHSLLKSKEVDILLSELGNATVIDFTSPDFASTLRTLSSCRLIISSSLHGLVIADSYGIPSLFWNDLGDENEWKFKDYFDGVGRDDYRAVPSRVIRDVAKQGRISDLPFSVLAGAALAGCLDDLRGAATAVRDYSLSS